MIFKKNYFLRFMLNIIIRNTVLFEEYQIGEKGVRKGLLEWLLMYTIYFPKSLRKKERSERRKVIQSLTK